MCSNVKNHSARCIWVVILLVCAVAWSFQLTSFLHAKGLVLAVGLVVVVYAQHRNGLLSTNGFQPFIPLWFGLVVWTISGLFTAQVLSFHIEKAVYLALLLFAASLAVSVFRPPGGRLWLFRGLLLSGGVIALLALLQYGGMINRLFPVFPGYDQRAYSVFGNQNLLGGFMAVLLALLLSLFRWTPRMQRGHFVASVALFAMLLGALLVSGTRTAWLAAVVGCGYTLLMGTRPRKTRLLLRRPRTVRVVVIVLTVIAILAVGAPLLTTRIALTFTERDVGGHARLWFWAGASRMIIERPLFGVGLGNYAYWSPYYQGKVLHAPGGEALFHNEQHTVHAHSEPLEWLAETGVLGSLFLLWFAVTVFRRRGPQTGALVALAVFSCFNTLWHSPPHVLAGLLLAGVFTPGNTASPRDRKTGATLSATAILLAAAFMHTALIPSVLLSRAEMLHVVGRMPEASYRRALHWPWPNPQARKSYAIFLLDESRFDAARVQLEQALEGMDTGATHLLLAICAEARGDRKAVLEHAQACLFRWPDNVHARALAVRYGDGSQ